MPKTKNNSHIDLVTGQPIAIEDIDFIKVAWIFKSIWNPSYIYQALLSASVARVRLAGNDTL